MLRRLAGIEAGRQNPRAQMNIAPIDFARTFGLFFVTALAELVGCYLPLLWLSGKGGIWLLLPAAISLAGFVWLLTLHPAASGRVYATYGAIYIAAALLWLWAVDGVKPSATDYFGVGLALLGAAVIASGSRGS
jgi:small multidrug resistance family-3 protein